MEIKINNGEVSIPKGYKAVIKGDKVVFELLDKFKDGDVLTLLNNNKVVFILKEDKWKTVDSKNYYYVCYTPNISLEVTSENSPFFCGYRKEARLATEEEKQFLFNKMAEKGLYWNPETKKVESIKRRAAYCTFYFYISYIGEVVETIDYKKLEDDKRWESGNYYLPDEKDIAIKDAAAIRAIFEKRVKAK
nr:MAG TPA: hypothetical protein [Caudoviricetes sp.]